MDYCKGCLLVTIKSTQCFILQVKHLCIMNVDLILWSKRARLEHAKVLEELKVKKTDLLQSEFSENRYIHYFQYIILVMQACVI